MGHYHKVLGVEATASKAEIKKAYRKHSSNHHPDKAAANNWTPAEIEKHEAEFKTYKEAYDNLMNGITDPVQQQQQRRGGGFDPFAGINKQMQMMMLLQQCQRFAKSKIIQSDLGQNNQIVQVIAVPMDIIFKGGKAKIETAIPDMTTVASGNVNIKQITHTLDIPPNMELGYAINHPTENLQIIPYPTATKTHQIDGVDLIIPMTITVFDAVLQKKMTIEHPNGSTYGVKIPQNVTHGKMIRLSGKGFPVVGNKKGDCFLSINLVVPTLSNEDIQTLSNVVSTLSSVTS